MRFRSTVPVFALALGFVAAGCAASDDGDGAEASAQAVTALTYHSAYVQPAGFAYEFENWDHDGANVDNPVSIVFVSSTPDLVSRVYSAVEAVTLTHSGSKMKLSGIGGSRPGVNPTDPWDSESAGRKGAFGCWGQCDSHTDIHIRTYGPDGRDGTQVYQGSFGVGQYYLIATTHFDMNENTPKADFGYQDHARSLLVDKMVAAKKWRVVGSVDVENACQGRIDPSHMCQHDGNALVVDID